MGPKTPAGRKSNAHLYQTGNEDGLINPRHTTKRYPKMKWTFENDRTLLLVGLGKEIVRSEYAQIVKLFPEGPTEKAIQERLAKLREVQKGLIEDMKIGAPTTVIHGLASDDEEEMGTPASNAPKSTKRFDLSFTPTEEEVEAANTLLDISRGEPSNKRKKGNSESPFSVRSSGVRKPADRKKAKTQDPRASLLSLDALSAASKSYNDLQERKKAENRARGVATDVAVDDAEGEEIYEEEEDDEEDADLKDEDEEVFYE